MSTTTPYSSTFGTLLTRGQVAQAVCNTLQAPPFGTTYPLLTYYCAEVERQQGLTPYTIQVPLPSSIRPGLDFSTWQSDALPAVIVVAQPQGDAERYEAGAYTQMYEVQIGAVVESSQDEWQATQQADWLAAALMGAVNQNGGLGTRTYSNGTTGTFSEKTVMLSAPRAEFDDPTTRRFVTGVVTFHVAVEHVVGEQPPAFPANPYEAPSAWPDVTTVEVELESFDGFTGAQSPGTGVSVTLPVTGGQIVVSE